MRILASRILCCGGNRQIHTDYRNPVEKKGQRGQSLSERGHEDQTEPKRERANPCLDRLLLLFWAYYIKDGPDLLCTGSPAGDYLLQTTKNRMLVITSKRML